MDEWMPCDREDLLPRLATALDGTINRSTWTPSLPFAVSICRSIAPPCEFSFSLSLPPPPPLTLLHRRACTAQIDTRIVAGVLVPVLKQQCVTDLSSPSWPVALLPFLSYCLPSLTHAGNYVMFRRSGDILYLSGHLPKAADGSLTTGKVR